MSTLYFAYDASLDPDRMTKACPGAVFRFTAHYPETRLEFVGSETPVPTLVRDPGNTVWGGVFEIPDSEVSALIDELGLGRHVGEQKAVDREGNKHACLTFVSTRDGEPGVPHAEYLESMIQGARHWNLPAGWVMGLEDLADDPPFS